MPLKIMHLGMIRRSSMVPADDHRHLHSRPPSPTTPVLKPLLQQQLASQPVRCNPPTGTHLLPVRHIKPYITHPLCERVHLACECGSQLADVMHTGQPSCHQPTGFVPARQGRRN